MAKTFQQLISDYKSLTKDSSTANETLGKQLLNDSLKEIIALNNWFWNEKENTITTVASQQGYDLLFDCDRIKNVKITIDSTDYVLCEVKTEDDWMILNTISSTSRIPEYFYIRGNKIYFYPTPSTDGDTITVIYQKKLYDLGAADYSTGTVSVTQWTTTVTGSGTTFTSAMVGRYIKINKFWYEITAVSSATSLTIRPAYGEDTVSGASYQISELVPLPDGFENLPLYKALAIYFESRDNQSSRQQASQYLVLYENLLSNLWKRNKTTTSNIIYQNKSTIIDPNRFPTIT